jgi:type 2 lantibiotic biosynthesis protein LanM
MLKGGYSNDELLTILHRAATLEERLQNILSDRCNKLKPTEMDSKIEEWKRCLDDDDGSKLQRRLEWDNIGLDRLQYLLGATVYSGGPLPEWLNLLNDVIKITEREGLMGSFHSYFPSDYTPLPFVEALVPFIVIAQAKFPPNVQEFYHSLPQKARWNFEYSLLGDLSKLAAPVLQMIFIIFRSRRKITHYHFKKDKRNQLYEAFLNDLSNGKLAQIFYEYSTLGRLMSICTIYWINYVSGFLKHLHTDLDEIQQTFLKDTQDLKVSDLKPYLSDRHESGLSTIYVMFNNGLELIYKPRDLGIEIAFNSFLNWLNIHSSLSNFKILRIINKVTHGWVEYVEAEPCSAKLLQKYYTNVGMILAVTYLFDITDLHAENIIAHRDQPILIDLETMLHPLFSIKKLDIYNEAEILAVQRLNSSVLRSGLLPYWQFGPDGKVFDISGIGGIPSQETFLKVPLWENINTDDMELIYIKGRTSKLFKNQPSGETQENFSLYQTEILQGFCEMYLFFLRECSVILSSHGPLHSFQNKELRLVIRDTVFYELVLQNSLRPQYMREGVSRSILLESIFKDLLTQSEKSSLWLLAKSEKLALEQLDIPIFRLNTSEKAIFAQSVCIYYPFELTPYERLLDRLKNLSIEDLNRQQMYIRQSLVSSQVTKAKIPQSFQLEAQYNLTAPPKQENLLQEAIQIANTLQKSAIKKGRSVTWVAFSHVYPSGRYKLQHLNYDLYNGSAGIALFFAALAKILEKAEFYDLALAALQPVREQISRMPDKIVHQYGLGGAVGCGSIIYGLTKVALFLQDLSLIKDAEILASKITDNLIEQDNFLDIVAGSAGTLLSFLSLYDATHSERYLHKAVECGKQLLRKRDFISKDCRAWRTYEGRALTGFSHGAAGISYALAKLYHYTNETVYLEGAIDGIKYEQLVFSSIAQNWPDYRFNNGPTQKYGVSWCHGAPGIGLARIGLSSYLQVPQVYNDIEIAISAIKQLGLGSIDHLCCGNAGRIEILLTSSNYMQNPELRNFAFDQARAMLCRKNKLEHYLLTPNLSNSFMPGLFQGLAGIAYTLLRLYHSDNLPCVLLWG